ncbi:uncharacterized protein N7459_000764, partial [Penicillium hispanicum]|uniref:uncharacterized protein n=1 Tax=Penicillium hispanicum TaxID=1080232 RepID=UPI0025418A88
PSPHRFTMQQEARNTETHTRSWSNSNLRHKAVHFVSAGDLQPHDSQEADQEVASQEKAKTQVTEQAEQEAKATPDGQADGHDGIFFIDSIGQNAIQTGLENPTVRSVLERVGSDDSSEDEVVFTGRKKPTVIETNGDELHGVLRDASTAQHHTIGGLQAKKTTDPNFPSDHTQSHAATRRGQNRRCSSAQNYDMMVDYVANIDHDYLEDAYTHTHVEVEGGIDVDQASVRSSVRSNSSTPGPRTHRDSEKSADEADETQVESSIRVLSNMHIDTRPSPPQSTGGEGGNKDEDSFGTTSEVEYEVESDDDDADFDTDLLEELAIEGATRKQKGGASKGSFPSASVFADALESDPYYGFDVMDFDRPSLQKKGKGKDLRTLEGLMLSDSDLELHLHEAWQTDRKKKKTKKKEREALRAQGLLGRKSGDPDLKVKYPNGLNQEELINEMRTFLLSPKDCLSLPPMTKHRRKSIHELANLLNLKSQSRGNGPGRFPMLLKTARTPKYTSKTISQVDHLLSGRKLNRRLFQSWGSDAPRPAKAKRGPTGAAVSYMDGDVVGASAPEIGIENRGRAMLEKMGWSSGTALGAANNKGILLPVAHVVKNSRAGLG